tara:strand:- start:8 stop:415 length:408 start_codon:yes stop_codon:yes gene_type:complete
MSEKSAFRQNLQSKALLSNIEASAARKGDNYDFDHVSTGDWSSFAQLMGGVSELDELSERIAARRESAMAIMAETIAKMGGERHPTLTKDLVKGNAISVNWEMKIISLTNPEDFLKMAAKTFVDEIIKNRRDSDG